MSTHIQTIEDERGDLVDVRYYDSQWCATEDNAPQPSWFPGGDETDYCVYCYTCGAHMWHGISIEDDCDGADLDVSERERDAALATNTSQRD